MPIIDLQMNSSGQRSLVGQRHSETPIVTNCDALYYDERQTSPSPERRPKQSGNVEKTTFLIPSPEKQKTDKVLCSGPVQRYRPGFSNEAIFVPRFLQLTQSMLNYYSQKKKRSTTVVSPLFQVPIDQIKQARLVEQLRNEKSPVRQSTQDLLNQIQTETKQREHQFCFEVELKEDYECLHLLKNVNSAVLRHHSMKRKQVARNLNRSDKAISMNLSRLQNHSPISYGPYYSIKEPVRSSIIKMKTGQVKLSVERSKRSTDPTEVVIKRTLSPKKGGKNKQKHRRMRSSSQPLLPVHTKKSNKTNRVVQGHAVAVRDKSQGKPLLHFLEDGSILEKEFGHASASNRSRVAREPSSWTSKQRDLFNGERRFIFGVKTAESAQQWIQVINTAVRNYSPPEALSARRETLAQEAERSHIETSLLDQQKAIDDLTELFQQELAGGNGQMGPSEQIQMMLEYSINQQNSGAPLDHQSENENVESDEDSSNNHRTGSFADARKSIPELQVHSTQISQQTERINTSSLPADISMTQIYGGGSGEAVPAKAGDDDQYFSSGLDLGQENAGLVSQN